MTNHDLSTILLPTSNSLFSRFCAEQSVFLRNILHQNWCIRRRAHPAESEPEVAHPCFPDHQSPSTSGEGDNCFVFGHCRVLRINGGNGFWLKSKAFIMLSAFASRSVRAGKSNSVSVNFSSEENSKTV